MQEDDNKAIAVLWLGFLGTAILWFIGFLYAWIVSEFGCQSAARDTVILGVSLVAVLQLVGRLVVLAIAFSLLRYCQRILKKASHTAAYADIQEDTLKIFLARSGLIAGQILFAVLLVESIPIFFFLKTC
ncbi:MAG: hypothetical protein ACOH5I_23950 [Oligoflexus sp.]